MSEAPLIEQILPGQIFNDPAAALGGAGSSEHGGEGAQLQRCVESTCSINLADFQNSMESTVCP